MERSISQYVPYFESIKINGRRAFVSEAGYIGICSQFAQPGDHLCIFYGHPLLLVVCRNRNDRDRLIGPAYLCGVRGMENEVKSLKLERYNLY